MARTRYKEFWPFPRLANSLHVKDGCYPWTYFLHFLVSPTRAPAGTLGWIRTQGPPSAARALLPSPFPSARNQRAQHPTVPAQPLSQQDSPWSLTCPVISDCLGSADCPGKFPTEELGKGELSQQHPGTLSKWVQRVNYCPCLTEAG